MTQIPWFDEVWNKNPWLNVNMFKAPGGFPILRIVGDFIKERQENAKEKGNYYQNNQPVERDMLSRFMELQENNSSIPPW